MTIVARQRMSETFALLRLGDTPVQARVTLAIAESYLAFAAVVDEAGQPVTLLTRADLAKIEGDEHSTLRDLISQLPPGIVIQADTELEDFVRSPVFVFFRPGARTSARGALVVDGEQLVGVLPRAVVGHFLVQEYLPGMETLGSQLSGEPYVGLVIVYCKPFNHRNELAEYIPGIMTCGVKTPYSHSLD